jgi:hypothetical protein
MNYLEMVHFTETGQSRVFIPCTCLIYTCVWYYKRTHGSEMRAIHNFKNIMFHVVILKFK